MKEQEKYLVKELSEIEANNISEFRVVFIRMLNSMKKAMGTVKNIQVEKRITCLK